TGADRRRTCGRSSVPPSPRRTTCSHPICPVTATPTRSRRWTDGRWRRRSRRSWTRSGSSGPRSSARRWAGSSALPWPPSGPTSSPPSAPIAIAPRLEDEGVNRIIDFMTRHESFASPEEAAVAVAESLPHRRQVNADNLRRNLRELPDGRWVWKHMFARRLRSGSAPVGGWRELLAGMADEARTLRCPVLVLRGAASDVLSNEGAEEIASLIPDARLATVGSAGHHAAGDNPETTVDLVRSFLAETGT